MNEKYLITGGSGKLGTHLQKHLDCDAPSHAEMDILDLAQLESHINNVYDGVIHLAAISDQKYAAMHQEEAYRINVLGSRNVAQICKNYSLKVYYLSTDYVFPGTTGNYKETDLPQPANWYGYTKLAGEWETRIYAAHWCIIRTSFRPSNWGFPTAFTNVHTSADYVDVIAERVAACIQMGINGIHHVGTPVKSFFDLARRRNPDVEPEECKDPDFPKNRQLNLEGTIKIL